ncbi:MAG: hypothetical protein LBS27_10385 [Bifidobacteriaceae bacterium]|jgi:hypothetical protein|nr:hypothetical protein [Bifidobacteriaceae bacterium]
MAVKRIVGIAATAVLAAGLGVAAMGTAEDAEAAVCNGSALKVSATSSKARNTCGHAEAGIGRMNSAGTVKYTWGPAVYRDWSFAYSSWGTAFYKAVGNFY